MHLSMKHISHLAILTFFTVFFSFMNASAQVANRLTGIVADHSTGESLPGATVKVVGSTKGTTANVKGEFTLSGISRDTVTIIVSYVGYGSETLFHDFKNQKRSHFTFRLKPVSSQLSEVEVTGDAEGQVKAMLEQRNAANIKNIVSAEQIAQFPDLNAADAIQRIPGITLQRDQGEGRYVQLRGTPPELTNFNINGEQIPSPEGNVRYVGMDIIPADQIDEIEVTKVLTPDMDGDGIGGTVNVITKKARSEKPEINALLAGGYNNLRKTGNYQLQFSYGQRYRKFGFFVNGSYYKNNQGSDNMEFKYAKGPFWGSTGQGIDNYHVQYREFQLRHYNITRERTGVSATLDYQFNDHSSLYLRGMYNSFSDDETRRRIVYDLDDAVSETYYLYGGIKHDVKNRKKIQNISTVNLGGEHRVLGATIDYEAAYALATEAEPNRIESQFGNPGHAIAMEINMSDPNWPTISFPDPDNATNAYDYDNYELDELLFQQIKVYDRNLTARLNIQKYYLNKTDHQGYIQFGGKVRFKHKDRDIVAQDYGAYFTTSQTYPGTGPKLSVVTVGDGFIDGNLLNHGYLIDHIPGADQMHDFFNFNQQFFILDRTETKMKSYGEDYNAYENIYAAYIMARHEIGKLMMLGGVRYEQTDIDYQGMLINTKNGVFQSMDTLYDNRTYRFILPQIQARYSFNPTFNLRGAVTYTYARPNFEDVLPYREEDYNEVKYGNPDLKFPTSLNLDLLVEKYLTGDGILSGGLFYKNIDNFIFYYKRFAHEGDPKDYGLVEITKPVNGNSAFVLGAELMVQSKLLFLPRVWNNFGVYLNYTFTYSEAYINQRYPANYTDAVVIFGNDSLDLFTSSTEQERITLPGQAMHTFNAALFYESKRFYAKLSTNFHDAFLYKLGADKDLDEYYDTELHLDFNANYDITKNLSVFVDLINLTNSPQRYYLNTPDRILKQEYYSWWGRLGFKLNF
jgi:TonB-dependent receptor